LAKITYDKYDDVTMLTLLKTFSMDEFKHIFEKDVDYFVSNLNTRLIDMLESKKIVDRKNVLRLGAFYDPTSKKVNCYQFKVAADSEKIINSNSIHIDVLSSLWDSISKVPFYKM